MTDTEGRAQGGDVFNDPWKKRKEDSVRKTVIAFVVAAVIVGLAFWLLPKHPNKEISERYYSQLQHWWGEYPQVRQDIFNAMSSDIMVTYNEYQSIEKKIVALKFKRTKDALYRLERLTISE